MTSATVQPSQALGTAHASGGKAPRKSNEFPAFVFKQVDAGGYGAHGMLQWHVATAVDDVQFTVSSSRR